jgi:diadenosine tetraphosphatase ApaH/serine/threonine PP2A family protein phosphatase
MGAMLAAVLISPRTTGPPREEAPSPIAVLSDVHGNRQALDAVLRAARQRGATEWWCVGDLVGYGADPVHTLGRCVAEAARCLAGNHDLGVAGRIPPGDFGGTALDALEWTRGRLGPVGAAKLERLSPADPDHAVPLFHASPRDPVWEYVLTTGQARAALEAVEAPLTFVGHTHAPAAWHRAEDGTVRAVPLEGPLPLAPGRWLVNPGSVGQPRDGDARAAWVLADPAAGTLELVRTPYDVAAAQGAILAAGLPAVLARRLADGR